MEQYNKYSSDFKTGDLILFNENNIYSPLNIFSYLIKYFTKSDWSHIGMIVRDPEFTEKPLEKGLYLWESSFDFQDCEDKKMKLGVQIVKLEDKIKNYDGIIHWRKLDPGNVEITNEKLKIIHDLVHAKPYDLNIFDWINALFEKVSKPVESRYFCSALVGRIYEFLGLIDDDIDWSIIRPSSFSMENMQDKTHIIMINGSKLENEIEIKK